MWCDSFVKRHLPAKFNEWFPFRWTRITIYSLLRPTECIKSWTLISPCLWIWKLKNQCLIWILSDFLSDNFSSDVFVSSTFRESWARRPVRRTKTAQLKSKEEKKNRKDSEQAREQTRTDQAVTEIPATSSFLVLDWKRKTFFAPLLSRPPTESIEVC